MKKLLLISFCLVNFFAFAQTDTGKTATTSGSTAPPSQITVKKIKKPVNTDTLKSLLIADTLNKSDSFQKVGSIQTQFSDAAKVLTSDTDKLPAHTQTIKKAFDSTYLKLLDNPFLAKKTKPIYLVVKERQVQSKDEIFYLLSGLLLFLGFIRLVFSRYFKNVFKLFFQPSFRQKQTREQLQQNNLPSLLLNLFFILSVGTYVSFLLQYYHLLHSGLWRLLLYTTASLFVLYLFKYILLRFAGWVFDVKEATEAYTFAVYLINKILGVILIPFTLLIAFSKSSVISIAITISMIVILLLFIYRYLVSYPTVRREVKVSVLHFFFYICAFEITPLLLIYKTLIILFDKSH